MSERTPHIQPRAGPSGSLEAGYFDQLYATNPDPWEFATSPYEAAKYKATLAALPRDRYSHAFEPGCSIGILTRQLAPRCQKLLATDISGAALIQARSHCAGLANVTLNQCDLSTDFPNHSFDLIVLSEVGYYLSRADLEQLRERIAAALEPAGHLLLVHYTGETNYPLSADTVHEVFRAWEHRAWKGLKSFRAGHYRLDLFERIQGKA